MPEQVYLHPIESTQTPKQSILHPAQADFPTKKKLESVLFSLLVCILFYKSVISSCRDPSKSAHADAFPMEGPKGIVHRAVPILIFILPVSNEN